MIIECGWDRLQLPAVRRTYIAEHIPVIKGKAGMIQECAHTCVCLCGSLMSFKCPNLNYYTNGQRADLLAK